MIDGPGSVKEWFQYSMGTFATLLIGHAAAACYWARVHVDARTGQVLEVLRSA